MMHQQLTVDTYGAGLGLVLYVYTSQDLVEESRRRRNRRKSYDDRGGMNPMHFPPRQNRESPNSGYLSGLSELKGITQEQREQQKEMP
jgi:hypothetical protein